MKSLLVLFIVLSSLISFSPALADGPGDGGVPWPLGESKPHDIWVFEFHDDAHRIEIHRSEYTDGQWLFDVVLTNLDGRYEVGRGLGVYDGKGYSFYVRDQWDYLYEFRSSGNGAEFTLEVVYFSGKNSEYKKVRAIRTLVY